MTLITRNSRRADLLARILNSAGYFRGKTRLADFFGRLAYSGRNIGTFPLPDGKTATVDLGDRIQRLMWAAAYEPVVTRCLTALLRPGDTFVDVGAHIGFFSLIASSRSAQLAGSTLSTPISIFSRDCCQTPQHIPGWWCIGGRFGAEADRLSSRIRSKSENRVGAKCQPYVSRCTRRGDYSRRMA
jgi:hypothetical protein